MGTVGNAFSNSMATMSMSSYVTDDSEWRLKKKRENKNVQVSNIDEKQNVLVTWHLHYHGRDNYR